MTTRWMAAVSDSRFSRRQALRVAGGAGTAALLAGRSGRHVAAQDGPQITAPDTGVAIPTDELTYRWVDSGDQKGVFFKQFFPVYEEAHANVTVQYDPLPWNEIAQVVPLGVQNGNAHDVFQVPLGVTGAQAFREGWVAALDDIVPDFEAWKAAFPPGAFVEGITMFDGKAYALPLTSNQRYTTLLLFNREYMEQAGYDPVSTPLTWEEYRAAAKKMTEQGAGQYYGTVIGGNQINQWADWVGSFAQLAGARVTRDGPLPLSSFDWTTGTHEYANDAFLAAIDLLMAMKADGSIFPSSLGMNAPQARETLPQGGAGMIIQGPWNVPFWQEEHPDFDFGVAPQPVPGDGEAFPLSYGPGGSNLYWAYAESPYLEITGDIFNYLGSPDGQLAWGSIVGVGDPPILPDALASLELDPRAEKAAELAVENMRLRPEPLVRNPDVAQVLLELKAVTPNFAETVQGIFAEQLSDPAQAMQDLSDRSNAELDRAIEAAQAAGAEVSRDDFVFPNWEPTEDFADDDYAALTG